MVPRSDLRTGSAFRPRADVFRFPEDPGTWSELGKDSLRISRETSAGHEFTSTVAWYELQSALVRRRSLAPAETVLARRGGSAIAVLTTCFAWECRTERPSLRDNEGNKSSLRGVRRFVGNVFERSRNADNVGWPVDIGFPREESTAVNSGWSRGGRGGGGEGYGTEISIGLPGGVGWPNVCGESKTGSRFTEVVKFVTEEAAGAV